VISRQGPQETSRSRHKGLGGGGGGGGRVSGVTAGL